jgi:ketosteroid isomerase-like protein
MSQENVEIVRGVFDAFRRRDNESIFRAYHPNIEWDMRRYSVWVEDQRVFHGHDGIREFFRGWLQAFEDYEGEIHDLVDVGDKVVFTAVDRARGKQSGVKVDRRHAQVWTMREGKVMRIQCFDDRAQALEALGLSEHEAHADS